MEPYYPAKLSYLRVSYGETMTYIYYLYDNEGVVRYVGRGTRGRYLARSGRSKEFLDILDNGGYSVIVEEVSSSDANTREVEHISKHSNTIINKQRTYKANNLVYSNLKEIFCLDQNSESGIIWNNDRYSIAKVKCATKGTRAGSLAANGYWVVPFEGKYVKVHRIVMCLHRQINLLDTSIVINHINGIRSDNRPENLEMCSQRTNSIKTTLRPINTSGVVGVNCYYRGTAKFWKARICLETGKRISKNFSSNLYGEEDAFKLACAWREEMQNLHYSDDKLKETKQLI